MTRGEATEKLKREAKMVCCGCMHPSEVGWCENHCQLPEAFNMAIEALEREMVIDPISKHDVMDILRCEWVDYITIEQNEILEEIREKVNGLLFTQPEPGGS